jgi:hypothetical protein
MSDAALRAPLREIPMFASGATFVVGGLIYSETYRSD